MLDAAGFAAERRALVRSADVRYVRQAYELTVPMHAGRIDRDALDALAADFHDRHRETYGHSNPGARVQLVSLRLSAVGTLDRLRLRHLPDRSEEHTSALQSLMRISYAVFCLKKQNQARHTPYID